MYLITPFAVNTKSCDGHTIFVAEYTWTGMHLLHAFLSVFMCTCVCMVGCICRSMVGFKGNSVACPAYTYHKCAFQAIQGHWPSSLHSMQLEMGLLYIAKYLKHPLNYLVYL